MSERQSFFSSDLGASGFYDDTDGTVFNPVNDDSVNRDSETVPKVTPTDLAESGHYASRIGSSYQVDNDLNGSQLSPRTEREPAVENGRNTPESGIYSRNIENVEPGKKQPDITVPGENVCLFKGSWSPENRGSGIYNTRLGSFKDSSGEDTGIRQSVNREENFRMSRKSRPFEKLGATTLSTMTEEGEQPPSDRNQSYLEYSRTENHPRMNEHDNVSNSSRDQNGQPPPWTDMIFNRGFNEAYLQRAWPRISLHLQRDYRAPSDPFVIVPGKKLDTKQQRNYGRYILCSLWWGFVALSIIAALLVVFLIGKKDDEPAALKEYVKVDMNMTVNRTYITAFNDKTSPGYKSFVDDFCSGIGTANTNSSSTYYGCQVTSLSEGSVVVTFTMFYIDTSINVVNTNVQSVIVTYIESNGNKLNQLVIITGTINVQTVTTVKLNNPPAVQGTSIQTTTLVTDQVTASSEEPTTILITKHTTNELFTPNADTTPTEVTETTTDIIDSKTAVTGTTIIESESLGTESTTTANQPTEVTSTENSNLISDKTQTATGVSSFATEQTTLTLEETFSTSPSVETRTSTPLKEQSSISSESHTVTSKPSTTGTVNTIANTDQTTDTSISTSTKGDNTTCITESIAATVTEQTSVTVPTTTGTEHTPGTEQTKTITKPASSTEPTTTGTGPTPVTELTTGTQPTTTVTNPTSVTEPTTGTEPTTTVTDPTSVIELSTTDTEQTSANEPTTTVTDQTLISQPKTIVTEPTATVTKPSTTVTEPKATVTEPSTTVTEPTMTVTEQRTTVTELITTVTEPSTSDTGSTSSVTDPTTKGSEQTSTIQTTTNNSSSSLMCPRSKTLLLFEGPVDIACSISNSPAYNSFHVYHVKGQYSVFDVKYLKDGNAFETNKSNDDISFENNETDLMLTFRNMSCLFDGTFIVELLQDTVVVDKSEIRVEVKGMPQSPSITLNPDQVVDLVFSNKTSDFYRVEGVHFCHGNLGYPPNNLEIDLIYYNGTTFHQFPTDHYKEVDRTNVSANCVTTERVEFALKFTEDMHRARVRCKIPSDPPVETLSEELLLIPRNICNCAENKYKRGHPHNCNAYVECKTGGSDIYPLGADCPATLCRNSISGDCSDNCSSAVCEEEVPKDFCIPPIVPTTAEPPSPYAYCEDKSVEVDSGAVEIQCTLNGTFSMLNITFRSSTDSVSTVVFQIDNNGKTKDFLSSDNITASLNGENVTISVHKLTCTTGDFYGVDVIDDATVVGSSSGQLFVGSRPTEAPELKMHPDQVEGLSIDKYKNWLHHSCIGDLGFPRGEIIVEVLKETDTNFTPTDISIESDAPSLVEGCTNRRKIEFEIRFTSEMNNAIIRCGVKNDYFQNFTSLYSNNETISLISNICVNDTSGKEYYPHPTDCESYVQCYKNQTLGKPCPTGLCFGVQSVIPCDNCNSITCPAEVISTLSTTLATTTEDIPSGIECEDISSLMFSENVTFVCIINQTVYERIDIDFIASVSSSTLTVAQISKTKVITIAAGQDNFDVQFVGTKLTVTVKNVSCENSGHFSVNVNLTDLVVSESARLTVFGAAEMPTLVVPHDMAENIAKKIECTAVIGNPNWSLQIWTRKNGSVDFIVPDPGGVTYGPVTYDENHCSYSRKVEFETRFEKEWNATDIKCVVSNGFTAFNESNSALTASGQIILIEDDYCERNPDAVYVYHPRGCFNYIWCVSGREYSYQCGTNTCFASSNSTPCVNCDIAPFPCNSTST